MLKVRLMGTKKDIVWFQKILQRHPKVEVLEISELYSNKGTEILQDLCGSQEKQRKRKTVESKGE